MRKPKDILDKKLYAFFMIYGIKTSDKSIPYIVQAMQEYAKEYHQSELLNLNKSDVISSVCDCKGGAVGRTVTADFEHQICDRCGNLAN